MSAIDGEAATCHLHCGAPCGRLVWHWLACTCGATGCCIGTGCANWATGCCIGIGAACAICGCSTDGVTAAGALHTSAGTCP